MASELREARSDDAEAIARLAARTLPEAWTAAAYRAALGREGRAAFVIAAGERLLGFALALRAADDAELHSIAVEEGVRGCGLGRRLLEATLDALRRAGARQVSLEVRRSNAPALALYAASGFRARGERARYYRDGEDALTLGVAL
ncbi:MAG TPA: ribosomal protein S18-alanine N-acetyltransferase [Myxococcota bacterium]|nr:ribosomal protein S18-alanine N-acetyltransferase [Myxococcota bacterium]